MLKFKFHIILIFPNPPGISMDKKCVRNVRDLIAKSHYILRKSTSDSHKYHELHTNKARSRRCAGGGGG